MTELHNLKTISDQLLSGLTAGNEMKSEIKKSSAVSGSVSADRVIYFRKLMPVLVASAAVLVLLIIGLSTLHLRGKDQSGPVIQTIAAGSSTECRSDIIQSFHPESEAGVIFEGIVSGLTAYSTGTSFAD